MSLLVPQTCWTAICLHDNQRAHLRHAVTDYLITAFKRTVPAQITNNNNWQICNCIYCMVYLLWFVVLGIFFCFLWLFVCLFVCWSIEIFGWGCRARSPVLQVYIVCCSRNSLCHFHCLKNNVQYWTDTGLPSVNPNTLTPHHSQTGVTVSF